MEAGKPASTQTPRLIAKSNNERQDKDMKYKYLINAEGDADELTIRKKLESLGLEVILVEKTMTPADLIALQDDSEIKDIEYLWTKMIDRHVGSNARLKETLTRIRSERTIKSMRDIAQAVYDGCEEIELSDAYSAQLIKQILTDIEK